MPTISRENTDALNAVITIELPKSDYLPKVEQKLKDYRKKATLKGFRPGQAPMSFIRQKFGNSILVDEINALVNDTLNDYFKKESLNYLGQPLPVANDTLIDINKPADLTLKFELGLAPAIDIQGLNLDNVLPYYDVNVDDEIVDKEVENLRRRFGTEYEEPLDIQEGDLLTVTLTELENGAAKEGGLVKENVMVSVNDIQNEELKEKLYTATKGDVFEVNVYELDKGGRESVRRYMLDVNNLHVINETFNLQIDKISRTKKAEMNSAFFDQVFPPAQAEEEGEDAPQGIADVEAFRERIREEIYRAYRRNVRSKFYRTVHQSLVEQNMFELPVEFLKKWLKHTRNIADADLEQGFDDFARNVRWQLLRDKLAERYEVQVTKEDVENLVRAQVLQYFNYQVPAYSEYVNNLVEQVMKDEKEVQRRYDGILDERVLERAAEEVGKDLKTVSRQEFEDMIKAENKQEEEVEAEN